MIGFSSFVHMRGASDIPKLTVLHCNLVHREDAGADVFHQQGAFQWHRRRPVRALLERHDGPADMGRGRRILYFFHI